MDESTTQTVAATTESVVEGLLPILLPFDPLIKILVGGIVRAHFNATHVWPTAAEVQAALPADWQKLQGVWTSYVPSGDGTFQPTVRVADAPNQSQPTQG